MRVKDKGKQEAIYKAAVSLAQARGLGRITISEIAKEAGVATGTVYVYFKNKEDLIAGTFEYLKLRSIQMVMGHITQTDHYLVMMKDIFTTYVKYCVEYHSELVFMEQVKHSSYINEVPEEQIMAFDKPLEALLNEGKRQMLVKSMDNQLLVSAMHGITHQFASLVYEDKVILDQRNLDDMFQTCWGAIKA